MLIDLSSPKIQKIISMLREKGEKREIIINNISNLNIKNTSALLGGIKYFENKKGSITVSLNTKFSENIQTAVFHHELLHLISAYEGWPMVRFHGNKTVLTQNEREYLVTFQKELASIFQHPYVYSRMINDFELDYETYFDTQVQLKKNLLTKSIKKYANSVEKTQEDIFKAIDYYHYPEKNKKEILDFYRQVNYPAYKINRSLSKKTKFDTPMAVKKSFNLVKKEVIKLGRKKNSRGNHLFALFYI